MSAETSVNYHDVEVLRGRDGTPERDGRDGMRGLPGPPGENKNSANPGISLLRLNLKT